MQRKKILLVFIFVLSIGFASITTSLILSGEANIGSNISDFDIYFSKASISSSGTIDGVDTQILTFDTGTLSLVGDTSTINYSVFNNSTEYDANVTISCTSSESDYYSIENILDGTTISGTNTSVFISSQEEISGTITISQIKAYAGDEKISDTFTCTLSATAVSKEVTTTTTEILTSLDGVTLELRETSHTFYGGTDDWSGDYHDLYLDVTNNTGSTLENFKIVLKFKNTIDTLTQVIYYGDGMASWNQDSLTYTIYGMNSYTSGEDTYYSNITIADDVTKSFGSLKISSKMSEETDITNYLDYYVIVSNDETPSSNDKSCEGENSELTCITGYSED